MWRQRISSIPQTKNADGEGRESIALRGFSSTYGHFPSGVEVMHELTVASLWHFLLPDPARVWDLGVGRADYFLTHWGYTLSVSLQACGLATFLAILFASLSSTSTIFRRVLSPFVVSSQSFPLQSIAPLLIIALGAGKVSHVFIATIITFFPLYSVLLFALRNPPAELNSLAIVTKANRFTVLRHISIPSAIPAALSGIRIAFTLSVLGAVVAEFIAPTKGIGHILLIAQSQYDVASIYLCVLLLITQGLAFHLTIGILIWLYDHLTQ